MMKCASGLIRLRQGCNSCFFLPPAIRNVHQTKSADLRLQREATFQKGFLFHVSYI